MSNDDDTQTTTTADGADLATFMDFLDGFAGGEVARELTQLLGRAVRATNQHNGKSQFSVQFTVEPVEETMWGTVLISHKVTEKPARTARAGVYETDEITGQIRHS